MIRTSPEEHLCGLTELLANCPQRERRAQPFRRSFNNRDNRSRSTPATNARSCAEAALRQWESSITFWSLPLRITRLSSCASLDAQSPEEWLTLLPLQIPLSSSRPGLAPARFHPVSGRRIRSERAAHTPMGRSCEKHRRVLRPVTSPPRRKASISSLARIRARSRNARVASTNIVGATAFSDARVWGGTPNGPVFAEDAIM